MKEGERTLNEIKYQNEIKILMRGEFLLVSEILIKNFRYNTLNFAYTDYIYYNCFRCSNKRVVE